MMRMKKGNRGSAMIIIIVVIAFVSILISTLYAVSIINLQMKTVDRKAKSNFYSAEGVLEQINLGLQRDVAELSGEAYRSVVQQYNTELLEANRRQNFNNQLMTSLRNRLSSAVSTEDPSVVHPTNRYNIEKLKEYITQDVLSHTVLEPIEPSNTVANLEARNSNSELVLEGLRITYTDDNGYVSVIETDICVEAPNMNFIQPSDVPEVFEYTLVANQKLQTTGGPITKIGANIYAGGNGLELTNGAQLNVDDAARIVVKGVVKVPYNARLTVNEATDLWAKEVEVESGRVEAKGRTYVADDLILSAGQSKVKLGGEYYGFGNGNTLTDAGAKSEGGGDKSAILVNGLACELDMTDLRRLLLSGSAEIGTGNTNEITYSADDIRGIVVDPFETMTEQLEDASIAAGIYGVYSISNQRYWSTGAAGSDENAYISISKLGNPETNQRFALINNSDGTISFRADGAFKLYLSVKDDNRLQATGTSIGEAEKFYLKKIPTIAARDGQYVLKSAKTGKYVSLGMSDNYAYADREGVTDDAQFFRLTRIGDIQTAKEPVVTFTYTSADTAYVTVGAEEWLSNDNGAAATITYSVRGTDVQNRSVTLTASGTSGLVRQGTINGLSENAVVSYAVSFRVGENTFPYSGTYTHEKGAGNIGNARSPRLATGVYEIICRYWNQNHYFGHQGNGGATEESRFWQTNPSPSVDGVSWEKVIVLNDGAGFYLYSTMTRRYAEIRDGRMYMSAEGRTNNNRFTLEYCGADDPELYYIKLGDNYLYANTGWDGRVTLGGSNPNDYGDSARFKFRWAACTTALNQSQPQLAESNTTTGSTSTSPDFSMSYVDDTSAKAMIKAPDGVNYTITGARMNYYLNGNAADAVTIDPMDAENGVFSCTVTGLGDHTYVSYMIYYTYTQNGRTYETSTNRTLYVHELRNPYSLTVPDNNANVNLGESLEIKSNQIAYLVPAECVGVDSNGDLLYGHNPMSVQEYAEMMAYKDRHPELRVVDFDKKLQGMGDTTLDNYRTYGTAGYQVVYTQTPGVGAMVYLYVNFSPENTTKFFQEYYGANRTLLENMMASYAKITPSQQYTSLILQGNMFQTSNTGANRMELIASGDKGQPMTDAQKQEIGDEELSYQRRFKALTTKLVQDYDELKNEEKNRDVFTNLVRDTAFYGIDVGNSAVFETLYGKEMLRAVIANGDYVYDGTNDQTRSQELILNGTADSAKTYMILAKGNVTLKANFTGIVIAGGTITIEPTVGEIKTSRERVRKLLASKYDPSNPSSENLITHFFIDGENYVLDDVPVVDSETGYADYEQCISYENWSKR